ncbi:MAG: amidophosphoribosyltransferase [Synergistaceae bacterium]|jgi:amidophosphoribosyltransferase|nr:amidophosphoribosyltransferase [Synergistaceae bacterium]
MCGVFGFWSKKRPVADVCYLGLFALQHRGQESAGIAVTDGMHIDVEKGAGLMAEAFKNRLPSLKGYCGIGHVRYSTFGGSSFSNIQPFLASGADGFVSLAHNGNLNNALKIRSRLEEKGLVFQSTSDSEVMLNLIAGASGSAAEERILSSLAQVEGAYSLVVMTGGKLIGVRDPHGFHPLCLGRSEDGYCLASETCALDAVGAEFVRDVRPGEVLAADGEGVRSYSLPSRGRRSSCVFEYIYFARPDSDIDGLNVWEARHAMGRRLAREYLAKHGREGADIVVPVPDTGIAAAIGFAAESGIPYAEGLIKNRYVGRTFILPEQKTRKTTVEMKLNPIRENLKDRRVVLIDDSIVRGTTSARLIELLRSAGAAEVHMCVSSPPITHPCYYGIDTSIRKDLIAAVASVDEIRRRIGTDSLHYLSLEGLLEAVRDPRGGNMCVSCFNGRYPTDVSECVIEPDGSKTGGPSC